MTRPRYIAPWHREGLEEADLEAMSAENVELLASLKGKLRRPGPTKQQPKLANSPVSVIAKRHTLHDNV